MLLASLAFPDIDPVAIQLGPLSVRWYGLAYLAGFVGAVLIARWLARRWDLGLSEDDLLTILLYAIVGVVVGGRLGYVLVYGAGYYFTHPLEVVALWDGGMSFHGGLVGILVAGVLCAHSLRMPMLTLWDIGAVGAPIGFGLGRLSNFINAELWGRVSDVPWAVVFPGGGDLPRHPSQLYEALLEGFVLLAIMLALAMKIPPRPRGELVGWLLAGYGAFRILAEFFREPDAQMGFLAGGVTTGQLLSLPMLGAGVWLALRARRLNLPQEGPRNR